MADTRYLVKRRAAWYIKVPVPRPLQAAVGRTEIVRTLGTRDLRVAQEARWAALAAIKSYLATFQTEPNGTDWTSPQAILAFAKRLGAQVQMGDVSPEDAHAAFDQLGWDVAQRVDPEHLDLTGPRGDALEKGQRLVSGERAGTLLSDVLDRHLAAAGHLREKTLKGRAKVAQTLIRFLDDPPIAGVTRRDCARYVTDHLLPMKLSPKTKRDWVSDLSALFTWARVGGYVDLNPMDGLAALIRVTSRGVEKPDTRRAWTDAELRDLLQTMRTRLKPEDYLHRLVLVAMYSGLRLSEICELRGSDLVDQCFVVRNAKNKNSLRRVPIHSQLANLVQGIGRDQFVIPGLKPGGYDARRAFYAGKRFSRYKAQWGLGESLVFHGLRRSFAEKLEAAGVPLSTAEMLLGHRRSSMSYGHYSKQVPVRVLREALERVNYASDWQEACT